MTRLLHRTLRSFVALLVAAAVFTPATAQAACVSACGGCSMSGGAVAPMPAMNMNTGAPCVCCTNPDVARMSSCDHGNDTSRSSVSVQPAETAQFTVALSTATVPPLAVSAPATVASATDARPPGVADGTRLRI